MADGSETTGRWRIGGGGAGRPRSARANAGLKWLGVAVVTVLLAANIGAVGWIVYQLGFATGPRPYFVAFWVGPYERPEFPPTDWMDADRRALLEDQVFPNAGPGSDGGDAPTLEVMRDRLEDLAEYRSDGPAVVYLSAYAIVDRNQRIQIMAADSKPYEAETQLPLAWALDRLKACPARNKLLVLDIMKPVVGPRDIGGTADGVGDLIAEALQDDGAPGRLNGPDLMVIAACGRGQIALGAGPLQQSVFGYFFHRGLTTDEADGDRNGAVSVRELADYLGREVDDWALRHRGLHQKPVLLGAESGDFLLAEVRASRPAAASPPLKLAARPAPAEKAAGTTAQAAEAKGPKGGAKGSAEIKEAPSDAGEDATAGENSVYPDWLAGAWTVLEEWWKSGDFRAAPRVYRRLTREAMRAELRWSCGGPEETVRRDLEAALVELTEAMRQAQDLPRPPERSVGQAREFGWKPDPDLTAALEGLFRRRHELLGNSPNDLKTVNEALAKTTTEILTKFQGKPPLDFAGALVEALENETFDAAALAFWNGLVEQFRATMVSTRRTRSIRELQFLSQLAQRSREGAEKWSSETARIAWRTVLAVERAHNQPETFAWARPLLDQASASLREASVLLLPRAANYASWDQIRKAWSDAHEKYQAVADRQEAVREGHVAAARALAVLVGLLPHLEARPDAGLQADWLETAAQCGKLVQTLTPPRGARATDSISYSALVDLRRRLDAASRKLLVSFGPGAVRAVVERCLEEPPRPELAAQIEALLRSPFLSVADRQALHESRRALEDRLEKIGRPSSAARSGTVARNVPTEERARRRIERMTALLELVGENGAASGPAVPGGEGGAAAIWAEVARESERAHATFERLLQPRVDDRGDALDRAGWLAPVYTTGFGAWGTSPVRLDRQRAARSTWGWLAAQYQYEGRDLRGFIDPERANELDRAARECFALAEQAPPEVGLRIAPPSPVRLSAARPTATVVLQLALIGAVDEGRRKVAVDVLQPEDARLEIAAPEPAGPEVGPTSSTAVTLRLRYLDGPSSSSGPPPSGLVVRARLANGRVYHALVPVSVLSSGTMPTLALSRNRSHCDDLPMNELRLRPIAHWRQPFHVFVKNPTDQPHDVVVELFEGETRVGESGRKPLTVAAHSSIAVPSFGAPDAKPDVELRELKGELRLRLREAGGLIDEKALRPVIAAPRDSIEIARAEFVPRAPGRPNRLTVELRARPGLAGPPCRVQLVLPIDKDRFPALQQPPKTGKFVGELKPGGPNLVLYAEGLILAPIDEIGSFYLNVDSVERALWFQCRFPQIGGPQAATVTDKPRITFRAQPHVATGKPAQLDVAFLVDDAPIDSRLDVTLGRDRAGRAVTELAWNAPAKRWRVGFDPGGAGGSLLFAASIQDQVWAPSVAGLVGPRRLRARLIDPTGTERGSHEEELVLDDQGPSEISVQLPARIARGKALTVRATVQPPRSKIKEVALIFGPQADFAKAEAEHRVFEARMVDVDGHDWSAELPIPTDAPASLDVTARFTTGVGLTAFHTEKIAVVDPPKPEDGKPAAPPRGGVTGTVREGNIVQRGLKVYLLGPSAPAGKMAALATVATDEDGAFSFDKLEPKAYRIYCIKQDGINNRKADDRVTVEAGKALQHDLDLVK